MIEFRKQKVQGKRLQDQHDLLQKAVADPEVCLEYLPGSRLYVLNFIYESKNVDCERWGPDKAYLSGIKAELDYCPWSGRILPGSLGPARVRLLRELSGLSTKEIKDGFKPPSCLAGEFVREDWWISRGLDVRRRPKQGRRTWGPGTYIVEDREYLQREPPPGRWRSLEAPTHLCERMARIFFKEEYMITYIPWTREYGFRKVVVDQWVECQPIRMMKFDYCPWCGTRLPASLKQEWHDHIAAEGRDPNDFNLPAKYLSDTWWKEAGL